MRYLAAIGILFLFDGLEAQTADFKIMTYNLMFYKDQSAPCSQGLSFSQKDQAFKTVFKAVDPDILCVNELVGFPDNSGARSVLNNVINTDGENNFTSAAYSNNSFSSITNMLFYDSSMFALAEQNYITNTLNNQSLVRVIDFYRLYYKDPALSLGADTVFFTVVAAHLKAGNSTPNANQREDAIQAAMDYLTNQVDDANVIFTGDLNTYSSFEGAYQELVNYNVASERFVDPGVPGSWNNNSTFAPLHTQSTHAFSSGCYSGGGLDDRFDFILHSSAVAGNLDGMSYKPNSMMAIGNDGAHFNQSINAGNNGVVSSAVADALYDFSDHLPVVAEYQISLSDINSEQFAFRNINVANPFNHEIVISGLPEDHRFEISLLSVTGRELKSFRLEGGQNEYRLPSPALTKGLYLLRIKDDRQQTIVKKVMKDGF